MTNPPVIKEIVPKSGLLFQEITLHPVLCKPKIMPLKSVTLEKLEKMQKQAQDKAVEMDKKQQDETGVRPGSARPRTGTATRVNDGGEEPIEGARPVSAKKVAKADVWKADEDRQSADTDDDD